jgi:hypothetical protein
MTSALDGDERSASRPSRALAPGKDPSTHWTGGWADLGAGLDTQATGQILCLYQRPNSVRPVCSQDTIRIEVHYHPSFPRYPSSQPVELIPVQGVLPNSEWNNNFRSISELEQVTGTNP